MNECTASDNIHYFKSHVLGIAVNTTAVLCRQTLTGKLAASATKTEKVEYIFNVSSCPVIRLGANVLRITASLISPTTKKVLLYIEYVILCSVSFISQVPIAMHALTACEENTSVLTRNLYAPSL